MTFNEMIKVIEAAKDNKPILYRRPLIDPENGWSDWDPEKSNFNFNAFEYRVLSEKIKRYAVVDPRDNVVSLRNDMAKAAKDLYYYAKEDLTNGDPDGYKYRIITLVEEN